MDFPLAPAIGQRHPFTPTPGVPSFIWDGEKWTADPLTGAVRYDAAQALTAPQQTQARDNIGASSGGTTGAVLYDTPQSLTTPQLVQARTNIYAAPYDAMAYSGMQINGAFEISQEVGGVVQNRPNLYCCDGWIVGWDAGYGATTEPSAAGSPPGFGACLKVVVTTGKNPAAADWFSVNHVIEGYRCLRLAWGTVNAQPITIAFWVKASRTGLHGGSIRNGAATFRSYPFSYTINASATWEYKTITIPGDTTGTWNTWSLTGLLVIFDIASGSNQLAPAGAWATGNFLGATGSVNNAQNNTDYFHLTGLLVLPGTQAPIVAQSPYVMRPYGEELLTCQRYFEWVPVNMYVPPCTVASASLQGARFVVDKRTTPTLGPIVGDPNGSPQTSNVTSIACERATIIGCTYGINFNANSGSFAFGYRFYADARL